MDKTDYDIGTNVISFHYTILLTVLFVVFILMFIMIMSYKKSFIVDPLFFFEKVKILLFIIAQSFFIAVLSNGDIFQDFKIFPQTRAIGRGVINYAFDSVPILSYIFQILAILTFVLGLVLLPIGHTVMNFKEGTVDQSSTKQLNQLHKLVFDTGLKVVSICFSLTFSIYMIRFSYNYVFNDGKLIMNPNNVRGMTGFYFPVSQE